VPALPNSDMVGELATLNGMMGDHYEEIDRLYKTGGQTF
jgi:hypothetical protein